MPSRCIAGMLRTTTSLRLSLLPTLYRPCIPLHRVRLSEIRKFPAKAFIRPPPTFTLCCGFSTSRKYASAGQTPPKIPQKLAIRENIYTIPNLLTVSRIFACPVLGWSILEGNYHLATGLLVYAGLTDLVRILSSTSYPPSNFYYIG